MWAPPCGPSTSGRPFVQVCTSAPRLQRHPQVGRRRIERRVRAAASVLKYDTASSTDSDDAAATPADSKEAVQEPGMPSTWPPCASHGMASLRVSMTLLKLPQRIAAYCSTGKDMLRSRWCVRGSADSSFSTDHTALRRCKERCAAGTRLACSRCVPPSTHFCAQSHVCSNCKANSTGRMHASVLSSLCGGSPSSSYARGGSRGTKAVVTMRRWSRRRVANSWSPRARTAA